MMTFRRFCLTGMALCLGLSFAPATARAEGSIPALADVAAIQVQPGRMGNKAASDTCGLSSGEVSAEILKALKELQLPATSIMETPSDTQGRLKIELYPDVVTINSQNVDCITWLSLSAQSRSTLVVPPSRLPRNVTISYWRGGMMISSTQISHQRMVKEGLDKLAGQLAKQYRLDQPPALPDFSK